MSRTENGGLCDPESCAEYQNRKCNLSGRFIFFIPGIKSISAVELPTNSFYAMNAAIQKFQTIGFMRGGRISRFLDSKHTPFYLTKRLVDVPRIDDEGRPVRSLQWLIELEAPVDVTALLRPDEGLDVVEARATEALGVLEGGPAVRGEVRRSVDGDEGLVEVPSPAPRAAAPAAPASVRTAQPSSTGSATKPAMPVRQSRPETPVDAAPSADDESVRVTQAAAALGVVAERFERYAEKRWGRGWKLNASGRKRGLDEVTAFAAGGESLRATVDAELDALS